MDCLADLTSGFEIIIVDNASDDYTVEILDDLSCRFPQVRYRRFSIPQSMESAAEFGLKMATGQLLFTTTPGARIESNELRRLWALRIDPQLLVARSRTTARRIDASLINRLTQWVSRVAAIQDSLPPFAESYGESFGGLQMMRRGALDKLQPYQTDLSTSTTQADHSPNIEISHLSHQQLASPKLVEARRRATNVTLPLGGSAL